MIGDLKEVLTDCGRRIRRRDLDVTGREPVRRGARRCGAIIVLRLRIGAQFAIDEQEEPISQWQRRGRTGCRGIVGLPSPLRVDDQPHVSGFRIVGSDLFRHSKRWDTERHRAILGGGFRRIFLQFDRCAGRRRFALRPTDRRSLR